MRVDQAQDAERFKAEGFGLIAGWRFKLAWLIAHFLLAFASVLFWIKDMGGSARRTALTGANTMFFFLFSKLAYGEIVRITTGEFAANINPVRLRNLFHDCLDDPGENGQELREFFLLHQDTFGIFMACLFAEYDSVCSIASADELRVCVPGC
jgi:hypothetical protein